PRHFELRDVFARSLCRRGVASSTGIPAITSPALIRRALRKRSRLHRCDHRGKQDPPHCTRNSWVRHMHGIPENLPPGNISGTTGPELGTTGLFLSFGELTARRVSSLRIAPVSSSLPRESFRSASYGGPLMRLVSLATLISILATANAPIAHAEDLFDIKPMADGVYAAIAKPQYKINCNAAIIMLGDSVLVVDTHSKPSAARALIEQIKKLTDKPVRYVVNTHFHWDHYQDNQAYPSSWPAGVEIIATQATRENIELRGIPRVKYEIATIPHDIEKLKSDAAAATDSKQKAELQSNLE